MDTSIHRDFVVPAKAGIQVLELTGFPLSRERRINRSTLIQHLIDFTWNNNEKSLRNTYEITSRVTTPPVRPEPVEGPFMVRQAHHEREVIS